VKDPIEFQAWPKIPRLFRNIIVTEKIDGTNAAIQISEVDHDRYQYLGTGSVMATYDAQAVLLHVRRPDVEAKSYLVAAQSRKRLITPDNDNFGFAKWVFENAADLVTLLGPGRHFGEWWGSGIQRGYGLQKGDKYFSLFNVSRYQHLWDPELTLPQHFDEDGNELVPALGTVPVLYEGPFSEDEIQSCLDVLREEGSYVVAGYDRPEGVVVYHEAAGQAFKVTLENDEQPKGRES
jgi:hypothetical protein